MFAKALFNWLCTSPLLTKPGAVIGLLLMLFVTFFNPFGLRESSEQSTETWLLRMFAPSYPAQAQADVVVVLIDDQALARMQASWPLRYNEQARLLRQLLSYQPKSVFVDVLFTQRRYDGGSTVSLQRVLSSADEQGIPLILADYRDAEGRSQMLTELRALARTAQVNWSGFGERYPLLLVPGESDSRTPALQMYQQGCVDEACALEPFAEPLLVRWGYWSDGRMSRFVDLSGCGVRGQRSNAMQLLSMLGTDSVRSQRDANAVERPQPCPYTRTLYANQLRDPRVAEVLRGKHVLLGAHIRGIPDLVMSPVQGQLPGVYWHAMALDNLLTQGREYWRSAPEVISGVSISDALEMGLVLVAGLVALWIPAKPITHKGRLLRWMSHYRFWFIALSLCAIGASVVLALWWHIAPLDWLGLILVIGLFYAYLGEPRLAAWWEQRIGKLNKKGDAGCVKPY
ncbi:CHASE2 domain-containing protein [Pseudomonas borbori]|uniref:Sensor domain CHASE2-containing protein n=1 Tax=Pseudomonas borbori TaxID=289003 RepID=A0A1I5R2E3_9PSED|nr:CHASE2 domain-containing protein [Pseudomonas borbori]SFP52511.1 sensor domain CHASE2-containing protein [Pseudomonas borbori]